MISGVHALIYSKQPEAVRQFFRDVLEFPSVDEGGGWLIFALPPAELAVHPTDGDGAHELYLMCDDVHATVADLRAKGVQFDGDMVDAGFGLLTTIVLPDGSKLGLYQPKHAIAHSLPR
jgi:predicted enzyme related to lactoylglutathione lyase